VFFNFERDHTELRPQHDDFIKHSLVPHYINQIEALGFFDKVMTVHPLGQASATGPSPHNMTLSIGRAKNVGVSIKKHFDAQKARGAVAKNVEVAIDAKGEGDKAERALLGPNVNKINQNFWSRNQTDSGPSLCRCRCSTTSIQTMSSSSAVKFSISSSL
jgi:hypothetical protein